MITYSLLGKYGRLGNQMWQIASTIGIGYNLAINFGFPKWKYAKRFGLELNTVEDFTGFSVYQEPEPYYNSVYLDKHYNWDLVGYFQSWKYFMNCEWMIKQMFNFPDREVIDYVSIHVRRGDYLNFQHIHTNLDRTDYYDKAISLFPKTTQFLVFSDDVTWCEDNFYRRLGGSNFLVIKNLDDFDSMSLMSSCKHHIIANSSFSWWGAYLGINKDARVIYPSRWVATETRNDRIPVNKNWEMVEL